MIRIEQLDHITSPSNNCVGGKNNNYYGQFTTGNDDETNNTMPGGNKLDNLIKRNVCDDPNQNRTPNFFVTVFDVHNGPWWQSSGGTVYAQNSLVSHIPVNSDVHNSDTSNTNAYNKCTPPHCAPYLVTQTCQSAINSNVKKSSVYPLVGRSGSGTINLDQPALNGGASSSNANRKTARDTSNTSAQPVNFGPREDFDYFFGLLPNIPSVGNPLSSLATCSPACQTGTLTIEDSVNLNISSGNYTIFVNGDLNIGSLGSDFAASYAANATPRLQVAPGAYLSFIVKGDINIRPQVGYANENLTLVGDRFELQGDSSFPKFGEQKNVCTSGGYQETGVIQGVFLADGAITVESNATSGRPARLSAVGSKECPSGVVPDKKFVGEGTFVAGVGSIWSVILTINVRLPKPGTAVAPPKFSITARIS